MFNLVSKFNPSGDQPQAIEKLVNGIKSGEKNGCNSTKGIFL